MSRKGDRKRLQILRFIAGHVGDNGFAPSMRQIGEAVGIPSNGSVTFHLNHLEQQGRIRRTSGQRRSLHLVLTPGVVTVPVVWCPHCEQHMPADHECLTPDLEALIRATQPDPLYGSPSDIDFP